MIWLTLPCRYFADGKMPSEWGDGARVVMVCSPKREVYKEWIKGRSIDLTMPLWTWLEMEKLWQIFFQDKVSNLYATCRAIYAIKFLPLLHEGGATASPS
jgi:hypothetical protein